MRAPAIPDTAVLDHAGIIDAAHLAAFQRELGVELAGKVEGDHHLPAGPLGVVVVRTHDRSRPQLERAGRPSD